MKKSILEKLADRYFERTGQSPEYSFFAWLDSCGINPTDKELQEIYDNIDGYLEEKNAIE